MSLSLGSLTHRRVGSHGRNRPLASPSSSIFFSFSNCFLHISRSPTQTCGPNRKPYSGSSTTCPSPSSTELDQQDERLQLGGCPILLFLFLHLCRWGADGGICRSTKEGTSGEHPIPSQSFDLLPSLQTLSLVSNRLYFE